ERLADDAAQTLERIGGEPGEKALRDAPAGGKAQALPGGVLAPGELRGREALPLPKKGAPPKERDVRPLAPAGPGPVGGPAARDTLAAAVGPDPSYERAQVLDACLALASRLAEAGRRDQAVKLLDRLLTTVKDPRSRAPIERLRGTLMKAPGGGS